MNETGAVITPIVYEYFFSQHFDDWREPATREEVIKAVEEQMRWKPPIGGIRPVEPIVKQWETEAAMLDGRYIAYLPFCDVIVLVKGTP